MKIALLLTAILSTYTFANVGDSVVHNLIYSGQNGSITQKVLGFDSNTATYSIENHTVFAGQTDTRVEPMKAEDIMTQDKVKLILTYCAQAGGVVDNSLGQKTCRFTADGAIDYSVKSLAESMNASVVWLGNVPVNGIVKATLKNGVVLDVTSFNWAK